MAYTLYDYVDKRGRNTIKEWGKTLQKEDKARLNQKLDTLASHGTNLSTGLLSDTKLPHIKKLRVKGRVQIRLMLCKGPVDNNNEFTLLVGAIEKGSKLIPEKADYLAEKLRQEIIQDPINKRCLHERII